MSTTQEHSVSPVKRGEVRLHLEHAPVTETSLGFYFQKIEGWHVLHQGILWHKFRAKYPELEILPTLLDAAPQQRIQIDLNSPNLRTGFANSDKTQLVQIQDGLLLHNWRKTPDSPDYRRYEESRSFLQQDWTEFRKYLTDNSLKAPEVTRCEMSYFNHLVRSEDWNDFSDLAEIFAPWKGLPPKTTYGIIQSAAIVVMYQMESGNVNVAIQPGIRANDGKEIVQFTLSSVVIPKSSEDAELFRCLDECHGNAQRAFQDFTTAQAREKWREKK
jgi:uncharacterized protein (TIGR04255 family)